MERSNTMDSIELRILGSVEAVVDGRSVSLGTAKQRCLLAMLALDAPRPVHIERLIDLLWGDAPSQGARSTVRAYVSRLRAALAGCPGIALTTVGPCYRLDVSPDQVDVHLFRRLVADAADAVATGSDRRGTVLFRQALALWRGRPLDDVAPPHLRSTLCAHLTEEWLAAWEVLADAELRLGNHAELLHELRELAEHHPLRERLAAQLVVALYRNGQRADALAHHLRLRSRLSTELGIDPSPEFDALYQRILRDDPALTLAVRNPPAMAGTAVGPAAAAVQVVPAELPADLATFTGRTTELERLAGLYTDAERPAAMMLAAIDGMAGVGKTALAVRWAHRVRHLFPDGQLFVDLHGHSHDAAPVEPVAALERLLRSLGVPGERLPHGRDELAALYRSTLADRRVMVVFDNAGAEEQVRPLLPGAPGCLVVVTSRRRLTGLDGACTLSLDVLPLPDAVELLHRVVGSGPSTPDDAGAVEEIVDVVGRLPLAVRIAAGRLRARPSWRPAHLAALLRDERERLSELDSGRQGVAAAFSLSYRELPDPARRLFRLLGLHPGRDIDQHAAATLTGTGVPDTRRVLEDLVDTHLVLSPAPGRYALHDLLRSYAAARAVEEEQEPGRREALTRLFEGYAHTAAAATALIYPQGPRPQGSPPPDAGSGVDGGADRFTDAAQASTWLDAELPNLLASAAYATEHGWPAYAGELSRTLWRHLHERSDFAAALALHGQAARAARGRGDPRGEAGSLIDLGTVHGRIGDHRRALDHLQQALTLYRQIGDRAGTMRALGNLGVVSERLGHYERALDHLHEALDLCHDGAPAGEATALLNLGIVYGRLGRYDLSVDHLDRALALLRAAGNRGSEARALTNLGIVHARLGDSERALDRCQQALAIFRAAGSSDQEGYALTGIGVVHAQNGRYDQALELLRRAIDLFREAGNRSGESDALNDLGRTLCRTGRAADALACHQRSLALAEQTDDRYERGRALDGLAHARRALGDLDQARSDWEAAAALYTELGVPDVDEVLKSLAELTAPKP